MWFILNANTEETIAMTAYRDAAEIIAASFPTECIIRWSNISYGRKDLMLFTEQNKSACA